MYKPRIYSPSEAVSFSRFARRRRANAAALRRTVLRRAWENAAVSVQVFPSIKKPKQTVPTGSSFVPPPGPASPHPHVGTGLLCGAGRHLRRRFLTDYAEGVQRLRPHAERMNLGFGSIGHIADRQHVGDARHADQPGHRQAACTGFRQRNMPAARF